MKNNFGLFYAAPLAAVSWSLRIITWWGENFSQIDSLCRDLIPGSGFGGSHNFDLL
jgi:hypothetical protein